MHPLEVPLIAIGLAMDAFAVAVAVGASGQALDRRVVFRLAFHFGLFQALMPLVGWAAGRGASTLLASVDHWIAAGILFFIGGRMIREGLFHREELEAEARSIRDRSRGWSLVGLSLGVSLDALALGLGISLLEVPIVAIVVVTGVVTALMTLVGLAFGRRLGPRFGGRAEAFGGLVLVAIGLRVLVTHLLDHGL